MLSVIVDSAMPFAVYFIISYWSLISGWIILALSVAVVLAAVYSCIVFENRSGRVIPSEVLMKKAWKCVLGTRTIAVFCVFALMLPFVLGLVFGGSMFFSTVQATVPEEDNGWTTANHMETLLNLRESVWETLAMTEKVDTLQTIANIESNYLGLPRELNIAVRSLDENTVASYDDRTHTINLHLEYFDKHTPLEMVIRYATRRIMHINTACAMPMTVWERIIGSSLRSTALPITKTSL